MLSGEAFYVPCGKCIGCRLDYSKQWGARIIHEHLMTYSPETRLTTSSFLTLTYNNEHLPNNGNLQLDHITKFLKRLRKNISPYKYFQCGEYGSNTGRAHHHAAILGINFLADRKKHSKSGTHQLYSSKTLDELWGKGNCLIGDITFESASYIARYVTKALPSNMPQTTRRKPTSTWAELSRDESSTREPEYATMSRRPGLGKSYFTKYQHEMYPRDQIVVAGRIMRPPRYYDYLLEKTNPELYEEVKLKRREQMRDPDSWERMNTRHTHRKLVTENFSRDVKQRN